MENATLNEIPASGGMDCGARQVEGEDIPEVCAGAFMVQGWVKAFVAAMYQERERRFKIKASLCVAYRET